MKKTGDSQHGSLVAWVNESDNANQDSNTLAEKARDYYDSKQWTDAEVRKLKKQKQAATVRNRIKPKMDGLMGMERSNRTTAKAFPRTPKHAQAATAVTESVRFCLQDNFYDQIRSAAWENLLIEGTCGVEVKIEARGKETFVKMNQIHWNRLIYDPHSRKKDFSDAKYLGQYIWMDYEDAVRKYPDAKDVLENMISGSSTYDDMPRWMDNNRKRVKIVELYWNDGGKVKYACFTHGGYCEEPKESPYLNEDNESVWPYEFATMFIDREGGRYGACTQLLDIQDEINKRGSKALHLMSVRQVRGERGAVEDVNKAREELAKPDGYIETTPGMEFEILKTGDMAAAQFQLLAEAKQEIDAVSYNAAAAGKETRMMSGVALRNREAASQTELAPMFDVLKNLDIRVYRKTWNLIQQYWKDEKWIRVTDDEQNLKWVGLNKPVTKGEMILKQAQEQQLPPEQLQQIQMKIQQDPLMQEIVHTENDIVALDMDIVMSDAPDTLTTQIEDFQVLGEMVKSGFPMPPEAVILASPLSNKDQILKMMKEKPQIPPEMQKQMEEMKANLEKAMQENQQLKSGAQEAQMKLQAGVQESQMKMQAKQQETQANLELDRQVQSAKIQMEREAAMAKMELDRQIAVANLEIEKMKIDANANGEVDQAIEKVKNIVAMHETKIGSMMEMKKESQDTAQEDSQSSEVDTASMMQMHNDMMGAIQQIVENLNQKKTITMSAPDGKVYTATTTVQ